MNFGLGHSCLMIRAQNRDGSPMTWALIGARAGMVPQRKIHLEGRKAGWLEK